MAAGSDQHQQALELARVMQSGCLGARVGRLHRLVGRHFDQALRPLGLTLPQMEILSALTLMEEPVKPTYVADKLSVERSTMSRNLALMESKDLVATTESSASGRSLAVTITPHGFATLAHAAAAWRRAQTTVLAQLGEDAPSILTTWVADLTAPPLSPGPGRSAR